MKYDLTSIDGAAAGSLELNDAIFGLEPRADIIARMVRWQLAKRQSGDHKTLGRAEIARTGKKMYKQKGTGGARHGSARVPQFRGGGRAFGPVEGAACHGGLPRALPDRTALADHRDDRRRTSSHAASQRLTSARPAQPCPDPRDSTTTAATP